MMLILLMAVVFGSSFYFIKLAIACQALTMAAVINGVARILGVGLPPPLPAMGQQLRSVQFVSKARN